jgi:uncharacterized membrane protein (Fun14 family)
MKPSSKTVFIAFLCLITCLIVPFASASSTLEVETAQSELLSVFTNFSTLIIFIIELILGLGLGYFSAKAFKSIIALIGIVIIGVLLNVWQAPQITANIKDQFLNLGLTWDKVYPVLMSLVYTLGLTTIFPITLGFIAGLVIALFK